MASYALVSRVLFAQAPESLRLTKGSFCDLRLAAVKPSRGSSSTVTPPADRVFRQFVPRFTSVVARPAMTTTGRFLLLQRLPLLRCSSALSMSTLHANNDVPLEPALPPTSEVAISRCQGSNSPSNMHYRQPIPAK